MNSRLLKGLAIALLSLLCLLGVGLSVVPAKARTLLRDSSESALGVPATLGGVDTSLSGLNLGLGLVDFDIHNPVGFEGAPLLHLGGVNCNLPIGSLLTGNVTVEHLTVDSLRLRIVQDGSRSNLTPILKKVAQSLRDQTPTEPGAQSPPTNSKPGPRLALKSLTLRGIGIDFELAGLGNLNIKESATLPDWTLPLEELRAPDGGDPTMDDLLAHLLTQLHTRALVAAEKHVPKEWLPLLHGASPKELISGGLERELLDALPAKARDGLKGAKNKLRGLLGDR